MLDVPSFRAAVWAQVALIRARRTLRHTGIEAVAVRPPPRLPVQAGRGVRAVLRRQPHTCLERALVLQAWEAAHGNPREVVIGVARDEGAFAAHAWLSGESNNEAAQFHELMRLPVR